MSSTIIKDKKELIAKLRKTAAAKNPFDAESSMPTDPNSAGTVTPPAGEQDNKKQGLPESSSNVDGGHDVQPGDENKGKPEDVKKPDVKDGNREDAQDAAQLKSLAKSAADIVASLKNKKTPKAEDNKKSAKENKNVDDIASDFAEGFTPEFHIKLASVILSTEEGKAFADEIVKREKGVEAAALILKAAAQQAGLDEIMEQEYKENMQKQAALEELNNVWNSMSKEDQVSIKKLASAHDTNVSKLKTDLEKSAYDAGAADAAVMMDSEESGEPLPIEGEEVAIEDVVMVLEQLVAAGQITPEDAQAILEAFLADQGGMPFPDEQAMTAEEMQAMPEMGKVASVVDDILK